MVQISEARVKFFIFLVEWRINPCCAVAKILANIAILNFQINEKTQVFRRGNPINLNGLTSRAHLGRTLEELGNATGQDINFDNLSI